MHYYDTQELLVFILKTRVFVCWRVEAFARGGKRPLSEFHACANVSMCTECCEICKYSTNHTVLAGKAPNSQPGNIFFVCFCPYRVCSAGGFWHMSSNVERICLVYFGHRL